MLKLLGMRLYQMFLKKIKCSLCSNKENEKKAFTLYYKSADGEHSMKICRNCAKQFNEMMDKGEFSL